MRGPAFRHDFQAVVPGALAQRAEGFETLMEKVREGGGFMPELGEFHGVPSERFIVLGEQGGIEFLHFVVAGAGGGEVFAQCL